jgi:hypothetical protein
MSRCRLGDRRPRPVRAAAWLRGRGAHPLHSLDIAPVGDAYEFYAVGAKKMRFVGSGADSDRSSIGFNDRITLSGIRRGPSLPSEQQVRGGQAKTDKNSGMGKGPNTWSREVDDPRCILTLYLPAS